MDRACFDDHSYMRILFVHQNFPGQYRRLLVDLAAKSEHELLFVTQRANQPIAGVNQIVYQAPADLPPATHPYLIRTTAAVLNAQAVHRVVDSLKQKGFSPDIMIGHNGWGETLYLKDLYPQVPLLSYFEYFYRAQDSDIDFDPEYPCSVEARLRTHTLNAMNLMGWQVADWGQTPTHWQQSQYPEWCQSKLSVIHEGIDTAVVRPDPSAFVILRKGSLRLTSRDEVITYVARNLEPYRGFHTFMRALPIIQKRRPRAHTVIVGGDGISYGPKLPPGENHRKRLLAEVGAHLDLDRIHFLGRLPYRDYVNLLRISSAHVYLTYPFVLSWSILEAMSAGCLVIGSKTPPVEEVIQHGHNGLLVDFFSLGQIAEAVDQALDHPDRMQAVRAQARQTILDRFDWRTRCLPRQHALIGSLIAGQRPVDHL